MMATIIAALSNRQVQYAIGSVVLVAGVWFGIISPYNNFVSTKKVNAALKVERAKTEPVIKRLAEWVVARDATIDGMNKAAEREKSKQLKAANEKTIQYNAVVKQNKELFAKFNAAMLSKSDLTDRLRNITEQSSSGATNTSNSGFVKRLGEAYAQCESDVSLLLETASRTNERAAKAEAGLRALKQ